MIRNLFSSLSARLSRYGAICVLTFSASIGIAEARCPQELNYTFTKLHSIETYSLCDAASAPAILVVNTASHCGFTPQFQGLEALYQTYKENGLVIVGFPSNDFNQEAASEAETAKICYVNNGVTFTMTSPVSVKGSAAHPLFSHLAKQTRSPSWNFNKYLISTKTGEVVHFDSQIKPMDPAITNQIDALL